MKNFRKRPFISLAAACIAFTLAACQEEEDNNNNNNNNTTTTQTNEATENTAAPTRPTSAEPTLTDDQIEAEALRLTFNDLTVTRPNGASFTASVIASCGNIARDMELDTNNEREMSEYTQACRTRTAQRLNYQACENNNFMAHVMTNNPALRLEGLRHFDRYTSVEQIGDNLLWDEDEVTRTGSMGMNTYTIVSVSDENAVKPYEGFERIEDCADRVFRNTGPYPLP